MFAASAVVCSPRFRRQRQPSRRYFSEIRATVT